MRPASSWLAGACAALALTGSGAGASSLAAQPADTAALTASVAGVRFMQGMLVHHAQALEMTALLPGRTTDARLVRLGERISVSQRDEIALMALWLGDRGQAVPDVASPHAHHAHGSMPGMATPAELADLAQQRGRAFDRRFLALMIRHHEGALVMVRDVLATSGGTGDGELFRFASDVDADQRAEIRRMRALLDALAPRATPVRRR